MGVRDPQSKMAAGRHPSRVDIGELKCQVEKKLGPEKARKYFYLLNQYLSFKMGKVEFDKHCIDTIGRSNLCLHNRLIQGILQNACDSKNPSSKDSKNESSMNLKVPNGYQRSDLQSLCRDAFPPSPKKGRTHGVSDRKPRDHHWKIQRQQSPTEFNCVGSKPPPTISHRDEREEAEQAARIYNRRFLTAPLGISPYGKDIRKVLSDRPVTAVYANSCASSGRLPSTSALKSGLEKKLEAEGLKLTTDSTNLLNKGLDAYLKRLIKPCLEIASSRSGIRHQSEVNKRLKFGLNGFRYIQKPNGPVSASLNDFQVAMELNPLSLGENWSSQLEDSLVRRESIF